MLQKTAVECFTGWRQFRT